MAELSRLYDIALVCGPYKTGTSLITQLLETLGYLNPASKNNPIEHGNGLTRRYTTRECSDARRVNRAILSDHGLINFNCTVTSRALQSLTGSNHSNSIREYVRQLPRASVVKDPQLTFVLPLWLTACQSLNRSVKVYFTIRDRDDLVCAWNEAYVTKSLLNESRHALSNMVTMSFFSAGSLSADEGTI